MDFQEVKKTSLFGIKLWLIQLKLGEFYFLNARKNNLLLDFFKEQKRVEEQMIMKKQLKKG